MAPAMRDVVRRLGTSMMNGITKRSNLRQQSHPESGKFREETKRNGVRVGSEVQGQLKSCGMNVSSLG
jgi:hypothetical protein